MRGFSGRENPRRRSSKAHAASAGVVGEGCMPLLNQQGGLLLWGVDDRPAGRPGRRGEPCQATQRVLDAAPTSMSAALRIDPRGRQANSRRGKYPPGADKPYSVNREIWVRVGSRTLRAGEEATAGLVERSASARPLGTHQCRALDRRTTMRTSLRARTEITRVGRFGMDIPASDEELLRRLYLTKDGQLTNAAVVLFARQPRALGSESSRACRLLQPGPVRANRE